MYGRRERRQQTEKETGQSRGCGVEVPLYLVSPTQFVGVTPNGRISLQRCKTSLGYA